MSDNHSSDNHLTEQKPVAFTVPLILASVLIFIIVMILSLCNPKHSSHHNTAEGHSDAVGPKEHTTQEAVNESSMAHSEDKTEVVVADSTVK